MPEPLLTVRDLTVHFQTDDGLVKAVDGISYDVYRGRALGIVGESGSGKSVSSLTVMGLTRQSNARISGQVTFEGRDLLKASDAELRQIRGNDIAMIFQDPLSSLHPYYKVGWQLIEAIRVHNPSTSKQAARQRAIELLDMVDIPEPSARVNAYPHEFSGGMRQRAMIAMALANNPKLLIADEPTTALDVTVQAGILRLLDRLRRESGLSVIMITHDLGVLSSIADHVSVFYAGRIVESGPTRELLAEPRHPYTRALLDALPHPEAEGRAELQAIPGLPPSPRRRPSGCAFHPRCAYANDLSREQVPPLRPVSETRKLACHVDPFAPS
jgi:peptide/nickel transport system ATP-binding protein